MTLFARGNMRPDSSLSGIYHVEGPKHGSLFHGLYDWVWARFHEADLNSKTQELLNEYACLQDDRLLALVGGLCVEKAIDDLLANFIPGYRKLRDKHDFTFSLKIALARSMRLIPSRFFTYCDLIRQIRNEFAHHLEYRSLSQLKPVIVSKLPIYLRHFSDMDLDEENHTGLFKDLLVNCIAVLYLYGIEVVELRKYMETDEFLRSLNEHVSRNAC